MNGDEITDGEIAPAHKGNGAAISTEQAKEMRLSPCSFKVPLLSGEPAIFPYREGETSKICALTTIFDIIIHPLGNKGFIVEEK